ncbi:MAG: prepilin-type N-terminal cleavage/methylation domain-containing protein [Patescibacteria group bacterium]
MKNILRNYRQKGRGFTIVETLVAISILMLALTGPLLIITQALKASYYSRDQITAFYLAQEAVEYIRNIRDKTSLSSELFDTDWLNDVTGGSTCATTGTCVNKYDEPVPQFKFNMTHQGAGYTFVNCGSTDCAPLSYDDLVQNGVFNDAVPYGGNGTGNSIFSRTIWFTTVPGDDKIPDYDSGVPLREVVTHVEIKWMQGTSQHKFVLESHLFNWKLEK